MYHFFNKLDSIKNGFVAKQKKFGLNRNNFFPLKYSRSTIITIVSSNYLLHAVKIITSR